jgi:CheY-like chemotaxis protein
MPQQRPTQWAGIRVEILGTPRVQYPDGRVRDLPPLPGDLLAALVLAGPEGRSSDWLRRELWSHLPLEDNNPVAQTVMRLRQWVPLPKPHAGGNYVLSPPPDQVDALMLREGVAVLGPDTPRNRVDALLGLWRGSPWERSKSRLRPALWADVRGARDRLVRHVQALAPQQRAELAHWNRFCEVFSAEAEAWRGAPARETPRRKRVLIVDDMIGGRLASALGGLYECEVVTSLEEWGALLQRDELDYDCALVDRHLHENMLDESGEIVLDQLRKRNPQIPTALMSAGLPFEDLDSVKQRLGVRTVIPKHNDKDGAMVPLTVVVQKLIDGR